MEREVICVFCISGQEKNTVEAIEREFPHARAMFATFERDERKNGEWVRRRLPLLNGYVFVYSDDLVDMLRLSRLIGVYRPLKYEDGAYSLRGADLDFARWIYENEGNIGVSQAIKIGNRIEVVGGPLAAYKGVIKDVNNQRRSALVTIEVGEMKKDVWLSFEWLT
ncbi:MAG: hypothetical protein PHT58_07605 [Eubacteriales bacterium]|nr:hypothetical protein [Eubacteriales bacterium]